MNDLFNKVGQLAMNICKFLVCYNFIKMSVRNQVKCRKGSFSLRV